MRVVSLVPSATETLLALGVEPVACTRFCEQPGIVTVGGTKNPDVEGIVALAPDLVVVNDEENRREDAERLEGAGLTLHSMSPRAVADVGPAVVALARELDRPVPEPFGPGEWERWLEATARPVRLTVFVPVWRRPWTSLNRETYGSSLLEHLGATNVVGDADARYPEVDLAELARAAPALALLPSEPYPFRPRHADEVTEALGIPAALVDGQDLFWWGARTPDAAARLDAVLGELADPAPERGPGASG